MARRHAAAGGIVMLVLLMLVVMWPHAAAAQDQGQDQATGQDSSGASSPRLFLPLASNKGQLQSTPDMSIWSDAVAPAGIDSAQLWVVPDAYRLVSANMGRLDAVLAQAPAEAQAGVAAASSSAQNVLQLPLPDGTLQRFAILDSPIMAPELAAKYPEIKTYEARGLDDPTATARLDRTPAGFHAMILSGGDTVFIDPYLRGNDTLYTSYYRSDYGNHYGKTRNELEPIAGPPGNETPAGLQAAPNTAVSWNGGDSQAVTWNVANTNAAPVSCGNVNILFSTDGGQTFPTTLAANTPNDGIETITVPGVNTTTGRVKVACAGNIFFDIGNANLTVVTANSADLEITKSATPNPVVAGSPLTYQINVINRGPADAQTVSVVDILPAGVTLSSTTPSQGSCSGTTPVTCAIGTLANGASASVTIVVNVDPALVQNAGAATMITINATVSSQIADPNTNNNSAAATTNVVAQADLAIVSFGAVTPPTQITVGQDTALLLRKVITNNGPSAPMDAKLTKTGTGPADTAVTPVTSSEQALALTLNEQRTLDESYTVRCNGGGHHIFTFTSEIQPLQAGNTDANQTNNKASVDVDIDCVVPVAINIMPGSFPNSINTRKNGVIPVGILTTKAGEYGKPLAFDAKSIDPSTVRFGLRACVWAETCGAFAARKSWELEVTYELNERTRDSDKDLLLKFSTFDTGITKGMIEACVKGTWVDGSGERHEFFGCDLIRTVN